MPALMPPVSIVVNNYNYSSFLRQAIDSAIGQSYENIEVIAVDDGSTDDSPLVIASYGDRITPVLKPNGGQASAFNAGFAVSSGTVVIFLDADDVLLQDAAHRAVGVFSDGMSKVHWPMMAIDAEGERIDRTIPSDPLPEGDLRAVTFAHGPSSSVSAPTSANAWSRGFLEKVMPIPEENHRIGADAYLFGLAPAFGTVGRVGEPQSLYRIHGVNNYRGRPFEQRLATGLSSIVEQWSVLEAYMHTLGVDANKAAWERKSYFHRLNRAIEGIESCSDESETIVLIDEARWGLDRFTRGRCFLPFLERAGEYWGLPLDDATAIGELARMVTDCGARKVAIAWSTFWLLDQYRAFAAHLHAIGTRILANENVLIYGIRSPDEAP